MDIRLSYLAGIAAIIIAFFPENNWAKFTFGGIGAFCFFLAFIFQNIKRPKKKQNINIKQQHKTIELTDNHLAVLKVFKANDGELTTASLIQQSTGLETIIINSTLDDLKNNKLINATNLDEFEGGWQYQLSDKGRKTIIKFT